MTVSIFHTLTTLPTDILVIVFNPLSIRDLCALALTCRHLYLAVYQLGWSTYMLAHPRYAPSISRVLLTEDALSQVRYHALSDQAWSREDFVARPISRLWKGQLQPLLAISPSRLIVAAGHTLYSYLFAPPSSSGGSPRILFEFPYFLHQQNDSRKDITDLTFAADGGLDRTLYVSFGHGIIQRVILPSPEPVASDVLSTNEIMDVNKTLYDIHAGDLIESLSLQGDLLLSLSSGGFAVLSNVSDPENPSSHSIELQLARGWSTYLSSTTARAPYAVLGTSSTTPLCAYNITESQLPLVPSAILGQADGSRATSNLRSAVYGLCGTPLSAHWGSDQIVVSGWYDGLVRVHDLRSSSRVMPTPGRFPYLSPLRPVMSFCDPWSYEPIYTVASGGGSSNHIAAGSARHSLVSFWDVRFPNRGWSVHAPGNDASPVYSIVLESSRLFGTTQSRPFVYDFGSGVTEDTYPRLPIFPPDDRRLGYRQDKHAGVSFYVTKYSHRQKVY